MKELIEIQSKLKAPKNQFNKFGGYSYRSCEDILEAVKPLLADQGCSMIIGDRVKSVDGNLFIEATVKFFKMPNSEGRETSITSEASAGIDLDAKGMSKAQAFGAASSYARKYALNGLFLIDDTKDADATNDHGKDAPPAKKVAKKEAEKIPTIARVVKAILDAKTLETARAKYDKAQGYANLMGDPEIEEAYENKINELGSKSA